jgi:hypothetical protein
MNETSPGSARTVATVWPSLPSQTEIGDEDGFLCVGLLPGDDPAAADLPVVDVEGGDEQGVRLWDQVDSGLRGWGKPIVPARCIRQRLLVAAAAYTDLSSTRSCSASKAAFSFGVIGGDSDAVHFHEVPDGGTEPERRSRTKPASS